MVEVAEICLYAADWQIGSHSAQAVQGELLRQSGYLPFRPPDKNARHNWTLPPDDYHDIRQASEEEQSTYRSC